ncbi:MAG TPA: ABC transporter substrate-binding protein, partial [Candidatus Baltobacteraceae bacterium]|nr:ABC transporter substrate-binding protein [Candidatus Baltobacteraceae bacterium]
QEVRMEVNPDFYLGRPKLNEVVYKILPDENTALTQLQTHEIDLIGLGTALKWPEYAQLAGDPKNGIVATRSDDFKWTHIDFNLKQPIVSDVQVRRALAYATDKNEIVQKIAHGSAIPADTDQQPHYSWAYTNDIVHYPYDVAKAKQLLEADGWKVGPDGIRVKNGQRLEFTMSTQTESTNGKTIQTVLQRQWREVGAQADIKNYPSAEFFDNSTNGILQGGHYDVAGFSWAGAADPDDSAIYSGDNLAPGGQNAMFWNNRLATDAMNDALKTVDQARRKKDYLIVQQQLALDVPTIILYFTRTPYVYNIDFKGFNPSPVISAYWDPWNYSI